MLCQLNLVFIFQDRMFQKAAVLCARDGDADSSCSDSLCSRCHVQPCPLRGYSRAVLVVWMQQQWKWPIDVAVCSQQCTIMLKPMICGQLKNQHLNVFSGCRFLATVAKHINSSVADLGLTVCGHSV